MRREPTTIPAAWRQPQMPRRRRSPTPCSPSCRSGKTESRLLSRGNQTNATRIADKQRGKGDRGVGKHSCALPSLPLFPLSSWREGPRWERKEGGAGFHRSIGEIGGLGSFPSSSYLECVPIFYAACWAWAWWGVGVGGIRGGDEPEDESVAGVVASSGL